MQADAKRLARAISWADPRGGFRPLQLADDKGGSVRKASETARPLCISRAPKDSQSDWEELSEPQGHSAVARPQPAAPAPDPPDARTLAPERAARGGRARGRGDPGAGQERARF